jgi:hypothetical protein
MPRSCKIKLNIIVSSQLRLGLPCCNRYSGFSTRILYILLILSILGNCFVLHTLFHFMNSKYLKDSINYNVPYLLVSILLLISLSQYHNSPQYDILKQPYPIFGQGERSSFTATEGGYRCAVWNILPVLWAEELTALSYCHENQNPLK